MGDNPGNVRWDLVPGAGALGSDINIQDLTSLIVTAPPMFGGNRAYAGQDCGLLGCTAANACCPTYPSLGVKICFTSDMLVYHVGQAVALNLAVTNISSSDVTLTFSDSCTTDTSTMSVVGGVFWTSSGGSLCTPIFVNYTLAPSESMTFSPPSPPATAVDTYKVMSELNASGCTGSTTCYAPECPLLACLSPLTPGYAIRRVP